MYMKRVIRLNENDLHDIIKESIKSALNEISSDMLDRASDKAEAQDRKKQMQKFKNGAFEKRRDELMADKNFDTDLSCYFRAHRGHIDISNNGYILHIESNGIIYAYENNVQYGNKDNALASWPLDYKHKISTFRNIKLNKQLALIIVNWCNKYLSLEGKERLKGFNDWHNWVQL